jgi:hypothetical protein
VITTGSFLAQTKSSGYPSGGAPGCLLMIVFSVVASVVLTVLVNLLL